MRPESLEVVGDSEARYLCLAQHAPTKSSEARGVHFLLALGLGLALGQYLSNPSCIDCCSACKGASLCCHLDLEICWVNSSFLSLFSAYRLLGSLGSVSILSWISMGI